MRLQSNRRARGEHKRTNVQLHLGDVEKTLASLLARRNIFYRTDRFANSTENTYRIRQDGNRMPAMPYEPFRVIPQRGAVEGLQILFAKGPITHESSPTLVEAVLAVNDRRLIIDLSEVPSLDSVAIGGLIRAYVHCQKSGRRLAFVGMTPRVTNVLRLTGVEPLFDSYATIGEAESAVS